MNFIKKLRNKEEKPVTNYDEFWTWFRANQSKFYNIVKSGKNHENGFFNKLSPKLEQLKDGFYYVTGMYDDNTAELIFTADGFIQNIVFVEELVKAAPVLPHWKFTALKPALNIEDVKIEMDDYVFDSDNLSFYAVDHEKYPDEIDIVLVYDNYKKEDHTTITNGTLLFLDNFLGELTAITTIDSVEVIAREQAEKELIPVSKLRDYLNWREREFVEKYTDIRHNTKNDRYSNLSAQDVNGKSIIAVVNSSLIEWDGKASHPWILNVEISVDDRNDTDKTDDEMFGFIESLERDLGTGLPEIEGYLNVARITRNNSRMIRFACRDFRKPSKLLHELSKKYSNKLKLTFDIYKDKYWRSLEQFRPRL
jgi:hypothetical protein